MANAKVDYEHLPAGQDMDESDVSVRYKFANMSDAKLAEYDPIWTDEQVMEWEPDFRNDGNLFLVCTERDIDVEDYRHILEEHIAFRRQNGCTI